MTDVSGRPVLITGATGLIGRRVTQILLERRVDTVLCLRDSKANRRFAATHLGARVRWGDLTDPAYVSQTLAVERPRAIVHLAAVIPPQCFEDPDLARRVNVESTRTLLAAAAEMDPPPRFVHASSIGVHGPRNPHREQGVLTVDTPIAPRDVYAAQKAIAETLVRSAALPWLILRVGGVVDIEQSVRLDPAVMYFESTMPGNGRIHTVDVRDAGKAFANAVEAAAAQQILMIGGDESHRKLHHEFTDEFARALGMRRGLPDKPSSDPDVDDSWYATDWMDTAEAQQVLDFQDHTFADTLAAVRHHAGLLGLVIAPFSGLSKLVLSWMSAYPRRYAGVAEPWPRIAARWPEALVEKE
ncbi:MAG: NAD-dependent epimerase/dehydratase family protein [Nocardioides sp.]|jgi:nucleoside-diphosphate-sugar epimerase